MSARQSGDPGDNGSCAQMHHICASSVNAKVSNPWSYAECLFGASCFGGQHPVDDFLASIYSTVNNGTKGTAPTSINEPRVPAKVFASISTDGKVITQQNWIDGYYSHLGGTNGPYPTNASVVIDYYNRIAVW
ncbi:hypothetical protein HWV62_21442 [Athelia sp. TMB]|nr:hypothetical protein HWV62_21442 [Athelia sp. TMB]